MTAKFLIRYGEIALKGKNRRYFEDTLLHNLKTAVRKLPVKFSRMQGRFLAQAPAEIADEVLERLSRVFGVVSVSAVQSAALDLAAIQQAAADLVRTLPEPRDTFKVDTRRPNKGFPLTSPEVNREVGAYLLDEFPALQVDVHKPSFTLSIEIGPQEAYLYHDRAGGPGGLPVGVTGKSLLLLSGGIDSPVAGWMAMKRGLSVEALHFHSFPFTSRRSTEKAIDLCRSLGGYGTAIPLHLVSLTAIQKQIRDRCHEELGITLLRRMMFRIAEAVCRRREINAIVTGENLGQVASQTLESLDVISAATSMLILRPLLCMDKYEIIDRARIIDTYEISIRPYEDCCTLFVPKHPVTRPKANRVEQAEAALDLSQMLREALDTLETADGAVPG